MGSELTEIRAFTAEDARGCELLVRDAFWNVYRPGCHEHYLWHRAMGHPDLADGLTLVATVGGELVGCIMSTRAQVVGESGTSTTVLAVGPVAVLPAHQGQGVGSRLIQATLTRARDDGFPGAFLYGDPAYYARFGFRDAERWRVTTAEGDNISAFQGLELRPTALDHVHGRLIESPLFDIDAAAVAAFDAGFSGPR